MGYTLTFFAKNSDNFFERNIMRIGFGLGAIPILGVILNLVKLPIDWKIFLLLSLILPVIMGYKNFKKGKLVDAKDFKLTKTNLYVLGAVLLFAVSFYMYSSGSFSYPWLEDGDPWEYATAAYYISEQKTHSRPMDLVEKHLETVEGYYYGISHYAEPYPIGYSMVMGVLKQTSPEMIWTLKFFNSLIISLGMLFFFFMVKQLSKNNKIAFFSTLVLFVYPSYLTHFIFSQAMAVTMIYPAIYAFSRMRTESGGKFGYAAAICTSAVLMTQMVAGALFVLVFLGAYFAVSLFFDLKHAIRVALFGILGGILAFVYWGQMLLKYGLKGIRYQNAIAAGSGLLKPGQTNTQFVDFSWIYNFAGRIDSPWGLSPAIFFLLIGSVAVIILLWKQLFGKERIKQNYWAIIGMAWLLLMGLNQISQSLPFGFTPHRTWPHFGIAIAIVSGLAVYLVLSMFRKSFVIKAAAFLLIFGLLFGGSFTLKWRENTVMWPQHKFMQDMNSDLGGYIWLKTLPTDTKITSVCRRDDELISFDKQSDAQWNLDQIEFKRAFLNKTPEEIRTFYNERDYDYFIIDSNCVNTLGANETNNKINELANSGFIMRQPQEYANFLLFEV